MIDCTINLRNSYSSLRKAVLDVGRLFTSDYRRIYMAYRKAAQISQIL